MKKIILIALCLNAIQLFSQVEKQRLGFIPYSDPALDKSGIRKIAYESLYEAATRIFINTQRFEILDRSKFDVLKLEKNFTKGEDFINSEIVQQGKALAAELLAVAKVTSISVTESPDKKGYSAFMTVEFKQIDVKTSKAINAFQLKGEIQDDVTSIGGTSISPFRAKSAEQAISKVITKMEEGLKKWIYDNFPIKMKILEWDDATKIIYAQGGKNFGITIRSNMCLRRFKTLKSGLVSIETITELKFTKTDGVGESTTRFELKNKKEWEEIVKQLSEFEGEIFVMECVSRY